MLEFQLFIPPIELQQIMLKSIVIFAGVIFVIEVMKSIILSLIEEKKNVGVEKK